MGDSAPAAWQQAWNNAQPRLAAINEAVSTYDSPAPRVLRVGQLDAELLDAELVRILREPIEKALALIHSSFRSRFDAELALFIQLVLYKLSVWDSGASYGAKIQGLRYRPHTAEPRLLTKSGLLRRVILAHGLLTIAVPYLHTRFRAHALSEAWPDAPLSSQRRRLWDVLTRFESFHSAIALANFVVFLCNGQYRTITDRLLRLKLVPIQQLMKRQVSYEFMNRQMVWHAFTEFLLFLLPLINTRLLRRRLSPGMLLGAVASRIPGFVRTSLGMATTDAAAEGEKAGTRRLGRYHALPDDQCAICADTASYDVTHLSVAADSYAAAAALSASEPGPSTNANAPDATAEEGGAFPLNTPYAASCGHKYCYVCLADVMLHARDDGGPVWACLRCASPVVWSERACADGTDVEDRSASESGSEYEFTDTDLDTDALGESTESIGSMEYPSNDSTSA